MLGILVVSLTCWYHNFSNRFALPDMALPPEEEKNHGMVKPPHEDIPWAAGFYAFFFVLMTFVNNLSVPDSAIELDTDSIRNNAWAMIVIWFLNLLLYLMTYSEEKGYPTFNSSRYNRLLMVRYSQKGNSLLWGVMLGFQVFLPAIVISIAMSAWRSPETQNPLLKALSNQPELELFAWVFLMACFLAPLSEELLFRVSLQGLGLAFLGAFYSIIITAILFSALHGVVDAIPLFPLAIMFGVYYHLSRDFVVVVTAHATFNSLMLMLSLVQVVLGEK